MESQSGATAKALPERIGGRYHVQDELGRGGMAVVYRVVDAANERELALKQLVQPREGRHQREVAALFEREYHTLAQLSHPRMIEVYDYGIDAGNAYYTMELLDGKDLRERSPLPWREACSLLFDVCSSLALLHSRRLVHRDVSPRNIRCTRDGLAKLIDFGALVPMGPGSKIVGTPPFVAPEVVHRLTLDARTDLFSLGATLYYALTGRPPFAARDFSEMLEAWSTKPHPPSSVVPDIPAALDALVMSLLSLEPALRPSSAYDVMQRLSVVTGGERLEPASVSRAYLSTPTMVGREAVLAAVRARISGAARGPGGGVLIGGAAGVGRSRMLDACVLAAKTLGATVLRADASAAEAAGFAVAQALAEQLLEALPHAAPAAAGEALPTLFEQVVAAPAVAGAESSAQPAWQIRELACASVDADALQAGLSRWFLAVARRQPLVIAVDDVHRLDEPSAALLATLAHQASREHLLLALTLESGARASAPAALAVIAEHCDALELVPLSGAETQELFRSVFGDVPNLELISARIHEVARGNPRESMDLAQHMIDKGLIRYAGGTWSLPSSLQAAELPSSAEQAFRERVLMLQPLSRFIAEAQALASHDTFTLAQYAALCRDSDQEQVDAAISELVSHQLLVGDGRVYALAHGNRAAALTAGLEPAALEQRHRALAAVYAGEEHTLAEVHHLLAGGLRNRALDRLVAVLDNVDERGGLFAVAKLSASRVGPLLERALEAAQALERRPRELHDLRRWLCGASVATEDSLYWAAAPAWLEQLERDSGLAAYRRLAEIVDPGERLKRALEQAVSQYQASSEAERVYRPDEAIKALVQYVVISIAIGARTLDSRLVASLPALLEPFAGLSPLVEAMWQNAIATFEVNFGAQQQRAHARVTEIYARLAKFSQSELPNVQLIRNALAYCAGAIEANFGLMSAMSWADILDQDSLQRVNAMHIRKVMRLQQGDPEGAEHFRKQAEVLAAQAISRQMFSRSFTVELGAYAAAHDLTGIKQCLDGITPLAARMPGWVPFREIAEGHFERVRGNLEAALAAYARCLALSTPDPVEPWRSIATWPKAVASTIEVLVELDRAQEAKTLGVAALRRGRELELGVSLHDIARALALAEAKLNDYARASARIADVIAQQHELGVTGLNLGASYEARARIAIWAGDAAAVEEFARLTAREYRHGYGSPLGALYERLMAEARRAGVKVLPELSEFESTMMATMTSIRPVPAALKVAQAMRNAEGAGVRAARALSLICEAHGTSGGHLFLLDERGLTLAASDEGAAAAGGLSEFASGYLTQELVEPEPATAPSDEVVTDTQRPVASWTDPSGRVYQPLLLTCVVEGQALCAGVAMLRASKGERQIGVMEIVAAVGAHLVAAGDTRAVPAQG